MIASKCLQNNQIFITLAALRQSVQRVKWGHLCDLARATQATSNFKKLAGRSTSSLCYLRESDFLAIFSCASSKEVFFTLFNPVLYAS